MDGFSQRGVRRAVLHVALKRRNDTRGRTIAHLYVFVCSKDPPGPVEGIDKLLDDHGRRSTITYAELMEPEGIQIYGSGDGLTLMTFLLWQSPGEIEVRWPERRRRERPDDLAVPFPGSARSPGLFERIGAALAGRRSMWR